jgi:hypothetical protein
MSGLNGTAADPWTPIKREPLGGKPAKAEPAAKQPAKVGVELNVGIPPDALKAITELAKAQSDLAEKIEQNAAVLMSVSTTMQEAAALQAARTTEAIAGMAEQAAAIREMVGELSGIAAAIEKAGNAPRKVTLRRNADGVAVDAISRPVKEGSSA